jgi:hypothetical protein
VNILPRSTAASLSRVKDIILQLDATTYREQLSVFICVVKVLALNWFYILHLKLFKSSSRSCTCCLELNIAAN